MRQVTVKYLAASHERQLCVSVPRGSWEDSELFIFIRIPSSAAVIDLSWTWCG